MRADRLLSILLLLQSRRRLTARELAERLEVCERTIHRDMEALSASGFPVVAERGSGGGWSLLGDYRTNLTGLKEAEIQALFLTRTPRLLADLGLDKASDAALLKISAALPAVFRDNAEYARQRIHIDVTGWNTAQETAPNLHTLQEAIWQERQLQFTYQRHGCDDIERLVDPLGLVAKGSVWYLVGVCEGEVRSYRVSRIRDASVTGETYARPAGFDLAAFWEQSSAQFKAALPRYSATVRVHPDIFPRLGYAGRFARIQPLDEPPDAAGWMKVLLRFDTEEMACEYVLSFGARMEVLEPLALREGVIRLAENVVTFYASKESVPPVAASC